MAKTNQSVEILFWIRSSRGTNEKIVYKYNRKPDEDTIREHLEEWCSHFGAWQVSENLVNYGYKILPKVDKKTLGKRWHNICEQKQKIDERYSVLRARMLAYERKV